MSSLVEGDDPFGGPAAIDLGSQTYAQRLAGKRDATTAGPLDALNKNAQGATDLSKSLGMEGSDLFGPAAAYLKKILSGDRQQLLEATAPERHRVIDQYATAKKALAEFTPRGGGQAGSMNRLQAQEASDLSGIGSAARAAATTTGLSAGLNAQGLGLQASGIAANDYTGILDFMQKQNELKAQSSAALGQGLGSLIPLLFMI